MGARPQHEGIAMKPRRDKRDAWRRQHAQAFYIDFTNSAALKGESCSKSSQSIASQESSPQSGSTGSLTTATIETPGAPV
jgi:hypothetical protein